MLQGLWWDGEQLAAGQVEGGWLRTAFLACVARLYVRPALLALCSPTRLTPLLRAAHKTHPDAYANTFIPFQTGKHQFFALLALSRSLVALVRGLHALSPSSSSVVVNAVAAGEAVGDSVELLLLARRYGGGQRRWQLLCNAAVFVACARTLALGKDGTALAAWQGMTLVFF